MQLRFSKALWLWLLFVVVPTTTQACCAESIYRLFPVGESGDDIVFVEAKLSRSCHPDGPNSFYLGGIVNLVRSSGDSLDLIQNIDTIRRTKVCNTNYSDQYDSTTFEALFEPFYLKGIALAKELLSFNQIIPQTIVFNDSVNSIIEEDITDSTFYSVLKYGGFEVDLTSEQIISCIPRKLAEVRVYKTKNATVTVMRLRCQWLTDEACRRNSERFKSVNTAFWKEQAQWHGIGKDFYRIKRLD